MYTLRKVKGACESTKYRNSQPPDPFNLKLTQICPDSVKTHWNFELFYYFLSLWVNYEILLLSSSKRCTLSTDSHLQFYLSLSTSPASLCTPTPILPSHLYPQMMIQVIFFQPAIIMKFGWFFFLLFINTLLQDLSSHCSETKIVHVWREPSHLLL